MIPSRRGLVLAEVTIDTDFAHITVTGKGHGGHEFLLEHALHQLLARYRRQYGPDATVAVIESLRGYHGRQ